MGHWEPECHSKHKKEHTHVAHDEEGLLLLVMVTVSCPKASSMLGSVVEASSSRMEIELKEEKVYAYLDEEKECDAGTWVLDPWATSHMFGCRAAFTKLGTAVLGTVHYGDDSVVQIEGRKTVVFMCKNSKSRLLEGVYFIPQLATSIMNIGQLGRLV
jgi:hypothetical protein